LRQEEEVWRHACPPWTLWPSWTWSIVESAAAAGLYTRIGKLAFEINDRVYRVTTRRQLDGGGLARPMPGSSPEFWPEDWRVYGGSDAYGWGATTANLLVRHLFGFKESDETHGWVADLTPAFPPAMLWLGARYGIRQMTYRGLTFDLTYVVLSHDLEVELELSGEPRACSVEAVDEQDRVVFSEDYPERSLHRFRTSIGSRHRVRLR
jgi:hypothetical protein